MRPGGRVLPVGAFSHGAKPPWWLLSLALLAASCSFDYGNGSAADKDQPDLLMRDVEYVRVRGGDPQARFKAAEAERYEERQIMRLRNLSFEQFDHGGVETGAVGSAGTASVDLESGDISLESGVRIVVDSEDLAIETSGMEWRDHDRVLQGPSGGEVAITRSDGTSFRGWGFLANVRTRTWGFEGGAEGSYTEKEKEAGDEESADEEAGEEPGDAAGETTGEEPGDAAGETTGEAAEESIE